MKNARVAVVLLALGLNGCMGVGMLARGGTRAMLGKGDEPPAKRVAAAQAAAIAAVRGGSPGIPIVWSDAKSGLQGALLPEAGDEAGVCRRYRQTLIVAGETLEGRLVACAQANGTWRLSGEPAFSRR
jgi:surface antigen